MALIHRFARLFRADLHAVLDRLEEPDILLRQSLREMEEEIAAATRALRLVEREREQIGERHGRLDLALARLAEELELAFDAGNETLVRTLLRRRLEQERLGQRLGERSGQLDAELARRREALADRQRRLEDLRRRAELLAMEEGTDAEDPSPPAEVVSDADVELAWLREKQRRAAP